MRSSRLGSRPNEITLAAIRERAVRCRFSHGVDLMAYDGESLKVVGTRPIRADGVDKVIGRANFGADMTMPGMLWGKLKRSPHAHARIKSINTSKAEKLAGVRAVVSAADFPEIASEEAFVGEGPMNFRDLSYNCMARGKVLYDGHAVAAVAATSPAIAEEAVELIEVEYEVLPYVIDVEDAMKPNAPILHSDLFTQGVDPKPTAPSNVAKRVTFTKGDFATGWKEAEVTIGAKKDGRLVAAELVVKLQAGAFPGSPVGPACMCGLAMYDIPHVSIVGYDVVSNRPKVAAYRAPGAPNSTFGTESCMDELARKLEIDPLRLREINAAKDGTKAAHGPTWANIGYLQTVEAAKNHPHLKVKLGKNQGRGVASGFWFNIGGESSAACHVNEDGSVTIVEGNPDIGGSRASMAMMAAEALGIPYDKVRPVVADTSSVGFSFLTGGSRVTFATGMAVTQAAEKVVVELKKRAAAIWDISPEAVEWKDGKAYPAGPNAGSFEPLSLQEIALKAGRTGGPISAEVSINAQGAGAGWATHVCDVEIDRETGYVKILRYTAVQDVGRAIHPSYVEGQIQGGVTQGIGWALNEEYIYDKEGRLENPGYLDYRMPVASDLPMIDAVLVEIPNPRHPFGAKGVGEVPIVPPMAAVANAIADAIGIRMRNLPMSPPRLREALDEQEPPRLAAE